VGADLGRKESRHDRSRNSTRRHRHGATGATRFFLEKLKGPRGPSTPYVAPPDTPEQVEQKLAELRRLEELKKPRHSDSMTLAVSHTQADHVILDLVRERNPPFSPEDVVKEFASTLKDYGIASVRGDRYGGMWPRERFAVHGVDYQTASQPKSDIYLTLLPLINSGVSSSWTIPD
jgi:hypothetical protein